MHVYNKTWHNMGSWLTTATRVAGVPGAGLDYARAAQSDTQTPHPIDGRSVYNALLVWGKTAGRGSKHSSELRR